VAWTVAMHAAIVFRIRAWLAGARVPRVVIDPLNMQWQLNHACSIHSVL
jgi:hypothetical protein